MSSRHRCRDRDTPLLICDCNDTCMPLWTALRLVIDQSAAQHLSAPDWRIGLAPLLLRPRRSSGSTTRTRTFIFPIEPSCRGSTSSSSRRTQPSYHMSAGQELVARLPPVLFRHYTTLVQAPNKAHARQNHSVVARPYILSLTKLQVRRGPAHTRTLSCSSSIVACMHPSTVLSVVLPYKNL